MANPVIPPSNVADIFPWSVGEIERAIDRATAPTTHGGAAITAREAAGIDNDYSVRGLMEIETRERVATGKAIEEIEVTPEMMRAVVARAYSNRNIAPRAPAERPTYEDLRDVKVSLERGARAFHDPANVDAVSDVVKRVACMTNGTEPTASRRELHQMLGGVGIILLQLSRYRDNPTAQEWDKQLSTTRLQLRSLLGGAINPREF